MVPASWNSHFGVQNVKLGKIWPRRFNGLEKTKLEPKFEVSISKNKETGQQCSYQKVWKILLLIFSYSSDNNVCRDLKNCKLRIKHCPEDSKEICRFGECQKHCGDDNQCTDKEKCYKDYCATACIEDRYNFIDQKINVFMYFVKELWSQKNW